MKYSLTRLLLNEDIPQQRIGISVLPPEAKDVPLNILTPLKAIAKAVALPIGSKAIDLAYKASPAVREVIDRARDYARRKDADISALISDTTVFTDVWSVLDPASSASKSDREDMSYALGYYMPNISPLRLKIAPDASASPPQTEDEFREEVALGVTQIKVAASIGELNDLRRKISALNYKLKRAVDASLIDAIRSDLKGEWTKPDLDLFEDPVIAPMLEAQEEAQAELEYLMDIEGRTTVFQGSLRFMQLEVVPSGGIRIVYTRRRPTSVVSEGASGASRRSSLWTLLQEDAGDPPVPVPPSAQVPARDLAEAIAQLISRSRKARSVVEHLRKRGVTKDSIINASRIGGKSDPLQGITYRFPSKIGILGGSTQITTQGSSEADRIATGIILRFLGLARDPKMGVPEPVIQMVRTAAGTEAPAEVSDIVRAMSDPARGLSVPGSDAQNALLFAYGSIADAVEKLGGGLPDEVPETLSSAEFIRNSQEGFQSYLTSRTTLADTPGSGVAGGIVLRPGARVNTKGGMWPEFVDTLMRRAKREDLPHIATTIPLRYQTRDRERLDLEGPEELTPEMRRRAADSKEAAELIKAMTVSLSQTTRRILSPTKGALAALKMGDTSSKLTSAGYLAMMGFCESMSTILAGSEARKLLLAMGYTSEGSLLLQQRPPQPQDVWNRLCEISGAKNLPAGSGGVQPFEQTQFAYWASALGVNDPASNGSLALRGIKVLIASEVISLISRASLHAAAGFRDMQLLSPEEGGAYKAAILAVGTKNESIVKMLDDAAIRVPIQSDALQTTKKGTYFARFTLSARAIPRTVNPVPESLRDPSIVNPLNPAGTSPAITASDDAPVLVDRSMLTLSSAPTAQPSPPAPSTAPPASAPTGSASPPTPTPASGAPSGTAAAASTAPPPAPAATSSPAASSASQTTSTSKITVGGQEYELIVEIPEIGSFDLSDQMSTNDVVAEITSGTLKATVQGTIAGGSRNATSSADKQFQNLIVTDANASLDNGRDFEEKIANRSLALRVIAVSLAESKPGEVSDRITIKVRRNP
jgi:hypothetical protein